MGSVGKRSGRHSKDQRTIDAMLVEAAAAGKRVVRLKGGDPSIFGRSTEELSALREAGYDVRICPGITTACAAAASAGISPTPRGVAPDVRVDRGGVGAGTRGSVRVDVGGGRIMKKQ